MREPKTPLPWKQEVFGGREQPYVLSADEKYVALFYRGDAAYAIHAANALPEVTAALREAQSVIDTMVLMMHGSPPTFFRRCNEVHATVNAALAKAEGGGG